MIFVELLVVEIHHLEFVIGRLRAAFPQRSGATVEKERCLQCRYDDLMMIELRDGQRWPNNNDDDKRGKMT